MQRKCKTKTHNIAACKQRSDYRAIIHCLLDQSPITRELPQAETERPQSTRSWCLMPIKLLSVPGLCPFRVDGKIRTLPQGTAPRETRALHTLVHSAIFSSFTAVNVVVNYWCPLAVTCMPADTNWRILRSAAKEVHFFPASSNNHSGTK